VRCPESKAPLFSWPITKLGISDSGRNKFEVFGIYGRICKDFWQIAPLQQRLKMESAMMCSTNNILWQNSLLPRKYQWETFNNSLATFMKCCGRLKHGWSPGEKSGDFWNRNSTAPWFASLKQSCHSCSPWNGAEWWCHRSKGSTHHNSTPGAQSSNQQRKF
jgi:hypothetical protein